MSASDHLSKALFHGSIEHIPTGTVIKPRDEMSKAWATPNMDDAIKHTRNRIESGLGFGSEGQHPHHGHIYEVTPITDEDASSKDFPGARSSKTGFIVNAHVASVLNPDLGARKHRNPYTNKENPLY